MTIINEDPNYCGTIIQVKELEHLPNMDNCLGLNIFGYNAIVPKTVKVGDYGIIFGPETQLSEQYCYNNNLYSTKELNADKEKKGYISNTGRVRAVKLRGNYSTCLFMPLNSLSFLDISLDELKTGDTFTSIGGIEICKKYISGSSHTNNESKGNPYYDKFFPKHLKTRNFLKEIDKFKPDDQIVVTCKLHGTSARFANQLLPRKLSWFERILSYFGININKFEYKTFCGSRTVVKDNTAGSSYYAQDVWNDHLDEISFKIPKNYIIYGEIIGWAGFKPIQKKYTYCLPINCNDLYVYRISIINEDGHQQDLSWDQIKSFCAAKGMKHVPEIWRGKVKDFNPSIYENKKFKTELGLSNCLDLDPDAPCDEGVVIRLEGPTVPFLTKFKSPKFLVLETDMTDKGEISMEDQN